MINLAAEVTSRIFATTTGVLLAVVVGVSATMHVKVSNRDKEIAVLEKRIEDPQSGYIAVNARCEGSVTQLRSDIQTQNDKIGELRRQGEEATKAAQEAVNRAQAAQATAERRAAQVLASAQTRPGEDRCAAAVRVIQESVQ